ncbi:MAG TPA: F0F1 ATP synthase subunit delta [Candidatus Limnocylindrales bacterium]
MARPVTSARRYAEALFELAGAPGRPKDTAERWREELRGAAEVVGDDRVAGALANPAIPWAERATLVERLLAGRVSNEVRNLVRLLAQRGRAGLSPAVATEYSRLVARSRGIASATVTSARPLTEPELAAIRERIESIAGSAVDLKEAVDPSLIGGVTVRIGDRLIDASVRGRLERLRERVAAGVR